jgi:hypothetical protein
MPTYDPLLLLQCDSQKVEPKWRYVAHNISKVFGPVQHLLPVDDEEYVALPHQALCVYLKVRSCAKEFYFLLHQVFLRKSMIKV